jgi:thioredoxin reductase/ferredoxin
MLNWLQAYARWLHLGWPDGTVEPLPEIGPDGSTRLPGVYVAGDLTGIPLLKFALDSGASAVRTIAGSLGRTVEGGPHDLVIVGAGVAGLAAAVEARASGLRFELIEASEPLSTLINFPRRKPIFTYPAAMKPAGELQVSATVKEELVAELERQVEHHGIRARSARAVRIERRGGTPGVLLEGGEWLPARRVLIAIGRSGEFRRLGVPGESLDKVANRLHDPADFAGRDVLVVGGGDAAAECAVMLAESGARVTLAHRSAELARPKPELHDRLAELEREGHLAILDNATVREIRPREVWIDRSGVASTLPNDAVFAMIGRHAPLEFFRRSGLPLRGARGAASWIGLALFVAFCAWLYNWKSGGAFSDLWVARHWFPTDLPARLGHAGGWIAAAARDRRTLIGTLAISASSPSFYYTLAYSAVVALFGAKRIRRRRTPYVTAQTLCLIAIQVFPLFLIPEIILPLLDAHGLLPRAFADALFPMVNYGHGREFWRAYGLILAWPLDVYNIFTHQPLWWWIGIGFVQTFMLIPVAVYFFGKGAYCGWICSCGALAETLGDTQRHKMPHGPRWNRLNLAGQVVLGIAFVLLLIRIAGWALPPGNAAAALFEGVLEQRYKWFVDVTLAGVLGYGLYFWFSGRVWCRFFCPLAALMHVYARFGRFAIVAEKKKCISCNVCTSVCHQGIDVMNFANRGLPMKDPECVRCSACVAACPTGVLQFGQVGRSGEVISVDSLIASRVRQAETSNPPPKSPRYERPVRIDGPP